MNNKPTEQSIKLKLYINAVIVTRSCWLGPNDDEIKEIIKKAIDENLIIEREIKECKSE